MAIMERTPTVVVGRSSFLDGIARIMDFSGAMNVYRRSDSAEEADARAMQSDFAVVGKDVRGAYEQCIKSVKKG